MEDYIITYTNIHFEILNPASEDICIKDIAHALSLLCRGNGHTKCFFSVAQHSINCAKEAAMRGYSKQVQLACLLHDASEAYLSDITRPLKKHLPEYLAIEKKVQDAIFDKYQVDKSDEDIMIKVKCIDDAMLYYELSSLMNEDTLDIPPALSSDIELKTKDFIEIENEFLDLYNSLA